MNLVEQHIITPSDKRYETCLDETRKSKDLRNSALFINRQHYAHRTGRDYIEDVACDVDYDYVSWQTVDKLLKKNNSEAYKAMLANSALETLKMVDAEYQSFFALKALQKQGIYTQKVNPPKYSSKDGYYPVVYNRSQLSQKMLALGIVKIPKTDITFDNIIHLNTMRQIRIVPKNGYIILMVLYCELDTELKEDNGRYAVVDPGVSNLAAVYSNVMKPFIISGGPLKSINQFYNKETAKAKSLLAENKNTVINEVTKDKEEQKTSHKTERLQMNRYNKINDYLHKASSLIVQFLLSNKINTFIVGHSKGWKQSTRMRHKSNNMQNYQFIPFTRFFWMLEYKCKKHGIRFIMQEESYTSQASLIDSDDIPVYDASLRKEERKKMAKFSGRRVKRGLYKASDGCLLNADINGAGNTLRKYLRSIMGVCDADKLCLPADRGFVMNPLQTEVLYQVIRKSSQHLSKKKGKKKEQTCA